MSKIILENVTKRWGDFYSIDHLNLVIEDNSFVTLLGPSGCGKTTTLRMIAGLETPTEGRITIGDRVVFDSASGINIGANKRQVGFLFQNYALWPNMTVYQNIAFGLSNIRVDGKKLSKEEIDQRVEEVSRIVKISMFMKRYPAELSGGQQQRVAIARTLAPRPSVFFMDEPLSNLDAKLRLEMRYELQRLHVETGATFVYVTHDQMEAMTLATKIALINNGTLQQYARPLELYHKPVNLFVADFVGNPSINFIEAKNISDGSAVSDKTVENPDGERRRFTQNADQSIDLQVFDDVKLRFIPKEPLDLMAWEKQRAADAEAAEKEKILRSQKKGYVEKSNKDLPFVYPLERLDDEASAGGEKVEAPDFVLGIRPEMIREQRHLNLKEEAECVASVDGAETADECGHGGSGKEACSQQIISPEIDTSANNFSECHQLVQPHNELQSARAQTHNSLSRQSRTNEEGQKMKALRGEIHGSMPSGRENTLKIRYGSYLLTAVIFGSDDFTIGDDIDFRFSGENLLLFDRASGQLISEGSLEIL